MGTRSGNSSNYALVMFVLSLLLLGRLMWPFLSILVLSFLLTGIFQPIYNFFTRRFSETLASLFTCLLIILVVFVPLAFFGTALSKEAYGLYQLGKEAKLGGKLMEILQQNPLLLRLEGILAGVGITLAPEQISKAVSDFSRYVGMFLYTQASSWAANILTFLFNFFLMILAIFYLLIDHARLMHFLQRILPMSEKRSTALLAKFQEIASAVLIGNGICGLVQGVLGGLLFSIFDFGQPILWGGVMGILAFLPIFGIGLVLIPTSIILLLKGDIALATGVFIFYVVLSFSVEYLLKPKMVGERVQMHTLLVFLSIMGGLSVFGFLGIVYGPLIIATFLTMTEIYLEQSEKDAGKERAEPAGGKEG